MEAQQLETHQLVDLMIAAERRHAVVQRGNAAMQREIKCLNADLTRIRDIQSRIIPGGFPELQALKPAKRPVKRMAAMAIALVAVGSAAIYSQQPNYSLCGGNLCVNNRCNGQPAKVCGIV